MDTRNRSTDYYSDSYSDNRASSRLRNYSDDRPSSRSRTYSDDRPSSRSSSYSSGRSSSSSYQSSSRRAQSSRADGSYGYSNRVTVSAREQDYGARSGMEGSYRTSSSRQARTSTRDSRMDSRYDAGRATMAAPSLFDYLPENIWVRRGIVVVAVLLLVFILFNLVTCIGGAFASRSDDRQATTEESSQAASSEASEASSASAAAAAVAAVGVESPWTDDGRFSTGDSALDSYVKKLCDEHTTQGDTFDKAAYATNIYVTQTDYVERENNQSPWGETWDVEYAKQYFEQGNSGNCYNFAAVTEYILKYFGYSDAEAQPCIVKLQSGDWGDHGLVFVTNKVDNSRCLVDDALGTEGWMLDINIYDYDVRNIAQNATVKGNVDALDDDDNPMPIAPGELTEDTNNNGNAAGDNATTDEDSDSDEESDEESDEDDEYYDSEDEESEDEESYDEESYDEESEEEEY